MAKENEKAITNREVKNSAFTTFLVNRRMRPGCMRHWERRRYLPMISLM